MVKSYVGPIRQEAAEIKTDKLISAYMTTKVISFHPDLSIYEAMQTLLWNKISGAPVINENHELVGVLSEGDCLKEIVKGKYHNAITNPGTVGEHMTTSVKTIKPNMTVIDAAHFFLSQRFRRFPVTKNGKLVGLLTQTDLMRAMNEL